MENRENKRGKAIAKMGLVEQLANSHFKVFTPYLRGYQRAYTVNSDKPNSFCSCLEYECANDREFMCEHKWAIWFFNNKKEVTNGLQPQIYSS